MAHDPNNPLGLDGFAFCEFTSPDPAALSLHNRMAGHGPDLASWQAASKAELKPHRIAGTMAFMVESCWPFRPTEAALERAQLDYDACWAGFPKAQLPR